MRLARFFGPFYAKILHHFFNFAWMKEIGRNMYFHPSRGFKAALVNLFLARVVFDVSLSEDQSGFEVASFLLLYDLDHIA